MSNAARDHADPPTRRTDAKSRARIDTLEAEMTELRAAVHDLIGQVDQLRKCGDELTKRLNRSDPL